MLAVLALRGEHGSQTGRRINPNPKRWLHFLSRGAGGYLEMLSGDPAEKLVSMLSELSTLMVSDAWLL